MSRSVICSNSQEHIYRKVLLIYSSIFKFRNGWSLTQFPPTPIMSNYLLAFAIGPFVSKSTMTPAGTLVNLIDHLSNQSTSIIRRFVPGHGLVWNRIWNTQPISLQNVYTISVSTQTIRFHYQNRVHKIYSYLNILFRRSTWFAGLSCRCNGELGFGYLQISIYCL